MSLSSYTAHCWHLDPNSEKNIVICDLCPRACHIADQKHGFCIVRRNNHGVLIADSYGRSTGFAIDPIEKKPLYHFLPGTQSLSFGAVGCNLECRFCQNHQSSKATSTALLTQNASPKLIAKAAVDSGCRSVSFTYNEPITWGEFAVDTAMACHDLGVKTVAVTNGYVMPEAGRWFFEHIDAVNVDLKAFSDHFYQRLTGGRLEPVLKTLQYLVRETDCWVEITNLLIPGENDTPEELHNMCEWIVSELGQEIPLHFSAFFPAYRLMSHPPTPITTLQNAYRIAKEHGIRYVYRGGRKK